MGQRFRCGILVALGLLSACTVKDTPAPPLQGPSTLALSLTIMANPDVLSQDGASQSQILVQARDANGQPAASIPFRAEITVGGTPSDYGSLSARTLVTGGDGRASLTYTAPPAPLVSVDTNSQVSIRFTPAGTDYANAESRLVTIRLVPPGVIVSPADVPVPSFTFTPTTPAAFANVVFDASETTPAGCALSWSFGDGGTATGVTATHQFSAPNTYGVTLTASNSNGVTRTLTQSVPVSAGSAPAAEFVYSPSSPLLNQDILFNAGASKPGAGRTITRYDWNFGSGTPQSGVVVRKSYDVSGSYTVVLTVTDDVGQTGIKSATLTVSAGEFTGSLSFSPTNPRIADVIKFYVTPGQGVTIASCDWDFGDGSASQNGGSTTATHTYVTARTYTVRVTIHDSAGRTLVITRDVTVTAT
jgi:PKD repeat protein